MRTLIELNPFPIGVETGPFRAIRVRSIEATADSGSGSSPRAWAATPTSTSSHSRRAPAPERSGRTASTISGPIPSPRIKVTGIASGMLFPHFRLPRQNHLHLRDGARCCVDDDVFRLAAAPPVAILRDPAEPMQQQPRHRLGVDTRVSQAEPALDLGQAEGSGPEGGAVPGLDEAGRLLVVLVLDGAEKGFDRVLDRDEARGAAILVECDRHVLPAAAHLPEELVELLELGDEERRRHV